MTFRDDHDAAIARADALEQELEHAQDKVDQAERDLEAERVERMRLQALLGERAKPVVQVVHSARQDSFVRVEGRIDPVGLILTCLVIVALVLFMVALLIH